MDYNFLEQVNDQHDNWCIKVRVVRFSTVYTAQNENEATFLEMVLLDEKNTTLHAAVRKELIPQFKNSIKDGHVYKIDNLKITSANDNYRPIRGTKKAWFLTTTIVTKIEDLELVIPHHYFEFASFQSLKERLGDTVNLTDIIGILHAVGHDEQVYVKDKPTNILRLELKMKEGQIIKITLWRNIAADFRQLFLHHNNREGAKVVAITSTTVKKFRDAYSINSTSTTRIYINMDTPEFRMLSQITSNEADDVKEIPLQEFANSTPEKRMVRNRSKLQQILAMRWKSDEQEKVFTVCATIDDIVWKFDWKYIGCENCLTKLTEDGDQFKCRICDLSSKYPTLRFKIQVKVSDETAEATFTLFDKDAQKLLNTTATQLLEQDNTEKPSKLYNLRRRTLIFEIKLSDRNLKEGSQTYTVTKTFVPTNLLLDQSITEPIKQEPLSQQPIMEDDSKDDNTNKVKITQESEKDDMPVFKRKIKSHRLKPKVLISSSDEESGDKAKLTRKNQIEEEHITSSDEEQILLHTLKKSGKGKTKTSGNTKTKRSKRISSK